MKHIKKKLHYLKYSVAKRLLLRKNLGNFIWKERNSLSDALVWVHPLLFTILSRALLGAFLR